MREPGVRWKLPVRPVHWRRLGSTAGAPDAVAAARSSLGPASFATTGAAARETPRVATTAAATVRVSVLAWCAALVAVFFMSPCRPNQLPGGANMGVWARPAW